MFRSRRWSERRFTLSVKSPGWSAERIQQLYNDKVEPSMLWNRLSGNSYTASLWIAVANALQGLKAGEQVAAFSYGSGFGSEILSLTAGPRAEDGAWAQDIERDISRRGRVDASGYSLLPRGSSYGGRLKSTCGRRPGGRGLRFPGLRSPGHPLQLLGVLAEHFSRDVDLPLGLVPTHSARSPPALPAASSRRSRCRDRASTGDAGTRDGRADRGTASTAVRCPRSARRACS